MVLSHMHLLFVKSNAKNLVDQNTFEETCWCLPFNGIENWSLIRMCIYIYIHYTSNYQVRISFCCEIQFQAILYQPTFRESVWCLMPGRNRPSWHLLDQLIHKAQKLSMGDVGSDDSGLSHPKSLCVHKPPMNLWINTWRFPKIGVTPNHPFQFDFPL